MKKQKKADTYAVLRFYCELTFLIILTSFLAGVFCGHFFWGLPHRPIVIAVPTPSQSEADEPDRAPVPLDLWRPPPSEAV